MLKRQKTRKHDFRASAIAYAELLFAITCFLMVCEIIIFLVKLLSSFTGQGVG